VEVQILNMERIFRPYISSIQIWGSPQFNVSLGSNRFGHETEENVIWRKF
jgi:hypothetical protein